MPDTALSNIDVVQDVLERTGALDIDGALASVAEDLVLELPFRHDGETTLVGDNARRFMRALPRLLASLRFENITVNGPLASGEIVAEYESNGETRHDRPYRNTYVTFFTVEDGLVTRWREYPTVVENAFRTDA